MKQTQNSFSIKRTIERSSCNEYPKLNSLESVQKGKTKLNSYTEKLKHPKWQRKRLEIMQRDDFKCQLCSDEDTMLHIHHIKYDNTYKNPWDYSNELLLTLCENCHETESKNNKEYFKNILYETFIEIPDLPHNAIQSIYDIYELLCTDVNYTKKEAAKKAFIDKISK